MSVSMAYSRKGLTSPMGKRSREIACYFLFGAVYVDAAEMQVCSGRRGQSTLVHTQLLWRRNVCRSPRHLKAYVCLCVLCLSAHLAAAEMTSCARQRPVWPVRHDASVQTVAGEEMRRSPSTSAGNAPFSFFQTWNVGDCHPG
ncbi:uncharacterized protein LOC116802848 isoform X2 [Drosophila sechellia]|uniref:uncharacterized protein LOC116802548 isoform X2 n=2 Tax=Drosophila sechellia TaxID=7238 RepID=UPI0013DE457E|nr:uncharacterized protein LOC116802548 isoform X2 [Drosophila sechellia]XP_032582952.1 uncharacterized protein LOC116802847 isoform X2 [Drosophila sechellia]XP_032582955.1 uncharacterized protein LOC116802848 isoform X2 [Drosophila sechellia]